MQFLKKCLFSILFVAIKSNACVVYVPPPDPREIAKAEFPGLCKVDFTDSSMPKLSFSIVTAKSEPKKLLNTFKEAEFTEKFNKKENFACAFKGNCDIYSICEFAAKAQPQVKIAFGEKEFVMNNEPDQIIKKGISRTRELFWTGVFAYLLLVLICYSICLDEPLSNKLLSNPSTTEQYLSYQERKQLQQQSQLISLLAIGKLLAKIGGILIGLKQVYVFFRHIKKLCQTSNLSFRKIFPTKQVLKSIEQLLLLAGTGTFYYFGSQQASNASGTQAIWAVGFSLWAMLLCNRFKIVKYFLERFQLKKIFAQQMEKTPIIISSESISAIGYVIENYLIDCYIGKNSSNKESNDNNGVPIGVLFFAFMFHVCFTPICQRPCPDQYNLVARGVLTFFQDNNPTDQD